MQDTPSASPPEWPARLGRGALFGILVVMPLLFWTSASEFFEWPKLTATRAGAVAIVVAAAWELTRRGPPSPHALDLPVLLYLGLYAASTLLSLQPQRSLGLHSHNYGGLASLLAAASAYLAVRLWARDPETIRGLLRWTCDAAMLVALYAFAQRMGVEPFQWALPSQERVFSTFGNPNYYAAYLCLLIPVSLALAETAPRSGGRLLGALQTLFLIAMLGVTFSRAGWAGAVVGGFTYAFMRRRSRQGGAEEGGRRRWAAGAVAGIAIFMILGLMGWGEIRARLESAARWKGSTLESRWLAWKAVPGIAGEFPWLGTGPETFLSTFAKHRPEELNVSAETTTRPAQAHNEFLHLLSTTGILGLGAFLGLLAIWVWRVAWPGGGGPGSTSTLQEGSRDYGGAGSNDGTRASHDRSIPVPTGSSEGVARPAVMPLLLWAGLNAGIVGFLVQSAAGFSTAGTAPFFWAFLGMAQALRAAPCPSPCPPPGGGRGTTEPGAGRISAVLRAAPRGATLAFAVLAGADLVTGIRSELALARGNSAAQTAQLAGDTRRKELESAAAGEAIRSLQDVVALDPSNDVAWRAMAEAQQRLPGGGREARDFADQACRANPLEGENPRIAAHVRFVEAQGLAASDPAEFAERLRLLRETEGLYRTAWELEPSRVIVPFQYAVVCAEAGDLRGAEALCREVQRLKPDDPDGYVLHADVCLRQGRTEEAKRLVDRALEIDPSHLQAGALRDRMGR